MIALSIYWIGSFPKLIANGFLFIFNPAAICLYTFIYFYILLYTSILIIYFYIHLYTFVKSKTLVRHGDGSFVLFSTGKSCPYASTGTVLIEHSYALVIHVDPYPSDI